VWDAVAVFKAVATMIHPDVVRHSPCGQHHRLDVEVLTPECRMGKIVGPVGDAEPCRRLAEHVRGAATRSLPMVCCVPRRDSDLACHGSFLLARVGVSVAGARARVPTPSARRVGCFCFL